MTDAEIDAAGQIRQVARSEQFKFIGAAILDQNRLDARQGQAQGRCDGFRRTSQPFGREVQQYFLVSRVREGLNFVDCGKSLACGYKPAKLRERFGEPGRKNRALVHGAQTRTPGFKVSDSGRRRSAVLDRSNLPLRAIGITERRRSVRFDRPLPAYTPDPAKRLAQDVGFVANLRVIRNMLILAATATPKVRAWGRYALR